MSFPPRLRPFLGIIAPLVAVAVFAALTALRLHRVDEVTNLVETKLVVDGRSATGYAGGRRNLIIPEHNNESFQWIVQTQAMMAPDAPWRIRDVRYDNAPVGRLVLTPSPYRWWLALVAAADRLASGRPIGLAIERIARLADPILFALLIAGAVALAAWRFGFGTAGVLSIAVLTLFPLGGAFLPAQPTDGSLVLVCDALAILLLLAAVQPRPAPRNGPPHSTGWFIAAGAVLGLALWINAPRALPVLAGIGLGGALAGWSLRRTSAADPSAVRLPWRHWAASGATVVLAGYLLEYFPDFPGSMNLGEIHPLYGLAWLGLGELLTRLNPRAPQPAERKWPRWLTLVLAILAILAVPLVLVVTDQRGSFANNPLTTCLTNFANSPVAPDLAIWLMHDGVTLASVATLAPLLVAVLAVTLLFTRPPNATARPLLALALGPVLVTAAVACVQLRSWNETDAVLLGLVVAVTATILQQAERKIFRATVLLTLLLALAPGAVLVTRRTLADRREPVSPLEVQCLLERHLSHWLADQAESPGAVVLAPPSLTMSMIYYGGLSGLGTPDWENKAGFTAAMRIAGASSPDEAQAIANRRNLAFIVVPSWDNFLEEYARAGAADPQHTLVAFLNHWLPPRWLRPVPYHLPQVAGFEGQSVAVFKVVEVQDNATSLSNLAEYFVEMGMMEQAAAVARTLERSFPADLNATVARVLVAKAAQDPDAFAHAAGDLKASLDRGDADDLAWDRRVSLAVALVAGRHPDQAKAEVKRCLTEINEAQLRTLTSLSLQRLLVMCRSFGLRIEDARLNALAHELLPPEMRQRL